MTGEFHPKGDRTEVSVVLAPFTTGISKLIKKGWAFKTR